MIYTLHGWSYDREVWKGTPFESAIHLELPGHGESPFKETDLKRLALKVGEVIGEGSTLVGWSLGATVSTLVTLNYPEKVKELILYAPTTSFKGISQPQAVLKRFLRRLKRNFLDGIGFFRNLSSKEKLPIPRLEPTVCTQLLESFINLNLEGAVREIEVPVKVAVGEEDSITGLEGAFGVFKGAPLCRMRVVPGADHLTILKYAI